MSALTFGEDIEIDGEDTGWHWRLSQPTGDGSGDVSLELAPAFHDWDGDDLQRLLHVIARKLQYTASLILSNPITEDDDE